MATEVDSQRIVTSSIVVPATAKRHVEETTDAPATTHGRKRSAVEELDSRQNDDDVNLDVATDSARRTNGATSQSAEATKRPRLDITNPDVRKRGQRMFANILGTLTKFKNEAQHKSEAEIKREQIEQKLHEKLKRERDELASKIRQEEEQRRSKHIEQKRLDEERKIGQVRNATRKHRTHLANFLPTDATPQLYYLPTKLTDDMARQIESQRAKVADQIREEEEQDRERERERERERQQKIELDGSMAVDGEIGAREASEERGEDVEMRERSDVEPEMDGERLDEKRKEGSSSSVGKAKEERSGSPIKEESVGMEHDKEHDDLPANRVEMSSLMGSGGDVVDYEVEDADEGK